MFHKHISNFLLCIFRFENFNFIVKFNFMIFNPINFVKNLFRFQIFYEFFIINCFIVLFNFLIIKFLCFFLLKFFLYIMFFGLYLGFMTIEAIKTRFINSIRSSFRASIFFLFKLDKNNTCN